MELSSVLLDSQHNLYDIYRLLCVQCWTPDAGQRNCPKHVEFYSKNKFEKLVHLFSFIIKISASCWFYYKNSFVHFCVAILCYMLALYNRTLL